MKRRLLLAGTVLLLLVGLALPYWQAADTFREPVRQGLQNALRREVEVSQVRFSLWPGPSLVLSGVVIHDSVEVSPEPLAYVEEMRARLGLFALLRGRIEFASLHLDEPSLNITRAPAGYWNIQALLAARQESQQGARGGAGGQARRERPAIYVRNGRVNFRPDETKAIFYLAETDLDLEPAADGFTFRVSAKPARTDRSETGFGDWQAEGRWREGLGAEGQLEVNAELDRTSVSELATLFRGERASLRGFVAARARIAGPLSNMKIQGEASPRELNRWELLSARSGLRRVRYEGRLDVKQQRLELATLAGTKDPLPVSVQVRGSGILSAPQWANTFTVNDVPLSQLLPLARSLGFDIADPLPLGGTLRGAVGYRSSAGLQGSLQLRQALWQPEGVAPLRAETAELLFDGDLVRLQDAPVEGTGDVRGVVAGTYRWATQALDLGVTGDNLPLAQLQTIADYLPAEWGVSQLRLFEGGRWSGQVGYRQSNGVAQWLADGTLTATAATVPGVAQPVKLESATLQAAQQRIVVRDMRAEAAGLRWQGDYEYLPAEARPHRFRLLVEQTSLAQIENLLLPSLRHAGLLARTFRLGSTALPDWLAERRADGTVAIRRLLLGDVALTNVQSRIRWDGPQAELAINEARWQDGTLRGAVAIDLRRSEPLYKLQLRSSRMPWQGGFVDVKAEGETGGAGVELLRNLQARGTFEGQSVLLGQATPAKTLQGTFEYSVSRGAPRLRVGGVQVALGGDTYRGNGANSGNLLRVELSNGTRQVSLSGSLRPLQVGVSEPLERQQN